MNFCTLSYPRSGATFIQFLIRENFNLLDVQTHNNNKIHYINKNLYNTKMKIVIVPLRNYKECVVRHNHKNFDNFNLKDELIHYYWPLEMFEKIKTKKHIIYYENLIKNTEQEILKLEELFNSSFKKILSNLEYYRQKSKKNYQKKLNKCMSDDKIYHHRYKLTIEQRQQWDEIFEEYNPSLFNKYLKGFKYEA